MKIAIASDDGKTISEHFGRVLGFNIFEIKNKKIIKNEYRKNIGKSSGECSSCDHDIMINNIKDCGVVISYGMGKRIYEDLIANNMIPIITEENNVHEAIQSFLTSNLVNRV